MTARVSVLMPTFRQSAFIRRAIDSLQAQTLVEWELIVVDDASPDDTPALVNRLLSDPRITYLRLDANVGLGAALNVGLERARAPFIAYLPSDDVYHADHLASLCSCLERNPEAALAYSGVRHHYNRCADGQIDGYPLQLVQVMHRATPDRWIERGTLVTDDLDRMFWNALRDRGSTRGTGHVTCEWVDHPRQRHKLLREPFGGVNPYRAYFDVKEPLRFHSSLGNQIDEVEQYRHMRERPDTPASADGLKILLVGELAYNADRILALEERGHRLYGLWTPDPYWFNTVGPLPFGHVEDIPRDGWQDAVRRLQPDVIYALLNWQAVPFAHHVLTANPGVPFVWHFKEGPFICLEKGLWSELLDLFTRSDGHIFSSPEMRDWFHTVVPELAERASLVLDGDLPKSDWFDAPRSCLLSESDGAIHTVVPGRPIGLHPHTVGELAQHDIHLHFYGDFTQGQWVSWIAKAIELAPAHLHLHANVDQDRWVSEFSRYDAGWLHALRSDNNGELRRATWDDLNYPARIGPLMAAGVPLLQTDNGDSIVATQSLARAHNLGLFFNNIPDLAAQLSDRSRIADVRESVWRQRAMFAFDSHVDRLIQYMSECIAGRTR